MSTSHLFASLLALATASIGKGQGLAAGPSAQPYATSALAGSRTPLFSADGNMLIFSAGGQIYMSRRQGSSWTVPERASFSDAGDNFEPFLLPDQQTLLFASTRPPGGEGRPQIWRVRRASDGGWGMPELALSSEAGLWFPNGPSEASVYFSGGLPGAEGPSDLWMVDLTAGSPVPARLPAPLNSPHTEWDPYLSPRGDYLLFASDRPGGAGRTDLYVSFRRADGGWGDALNLGPTVNTSAHETAAVVSPDGREIYFIREPDRTFRIDAAVVEMLRPR